ncbi:MAG: TetR/AcrR family transcriptional regulator [Actinobacteria bacterium]|nr:TetR/AcrR family transcriptional regulator [Actinomycetota bacterium]
MPKPAGLTNAQLTERTRTALLDATVECLAERGYAKTSTTEIARRAGVSRGAQVHHFPTKSDLVTAAVDHLFVRGTNEFRELFGALPDSERTFDRATELLWTMFSGEAFRAGLGLIVAGGSDDKLRAVLNEAVQVFQQDVARTFVELFPEAGGQTMSATAVVFAFAVVMGAAVYRQVGLDAYAEESIGVLRMLAQVAMPSLVAFPSVPRPATAPEPNEELP